MYAHKFTSKRSQVFSNKIPTCIFQLPVFYITAKDLFFNHIDMFSPCRDVALQLIAKLNNLFWMFACVLHRTCAIVCQEIKCLIYWKTLFDIILNTLGQSLFTCLNFISLIKVRSDVLSLPTTIRLDKGQSKQFVETLIFRIWFEVKTSGCLKATKRCLY